MSSGVSGIKWAWVVIGAIVATVVAFLLTLIIQLGYGLVLGFQLRGSPPLIVAQRALRGYPWGLEIWTLLIFAAAVIGGLLAGWLAARRAETSY